MRLTTQIPNIIKIASRDKRITVSRGNVKATPVKSYADINDKSFYLLEILDVLKSFKQIPDLDKSSAIKIISTKLKELSPVETKLLIKCSLAYPPRARGLLGTLLGNINTTTDLTTLNKSLNPLSIYEYGIDKKQLLTAENWNVK